MAVGEHVTSVYPGSADRARFDVYPPASEQHTRKMEWSDEDLREFALYQRLRELRESGDVNDAALSALFDTVKAEAPDAWLLWLELLELAPAGSGLATALRSGLEAMTKTDAEIRLLVERGIKLLDNPVAVPSASAA
jgi:phenylalanine-4-hydroxylase